MASHIVIKDTIIKCRNCKSLYVPDLMVNSLPDRFESCPVCGENCNSKKDVILLWRYNLIKFFRGKWNDNDDEEFLDTTEKIENPLITCEDCLYKCNNTCMKLCVKQKFKDLCFYYTKKGK